MENSTQALPAGRRVGQYQIIQKIGAGGMGVVYKALDLKLERTVALKFLPYEIGVSEKNKERFLREAKTASALDHTNIGVIHGIEETGDGQLFIVMAYYEGESLAEKLSRGPLPVREAVEIAIQIARGLAEAHAHNIVHRDIKPSNVMITSQAAAKIVDFGIARVFTATLATQSQGVAAGTVGYMSPEQAMGKSVDQRSDIWSLGIVIAEMTSGRNPFQRDTVTALLLAILNQPPEPMPDLPIELRKIIYRALAKDPAARYADCLEMLVDLENFRSTILAGAASAAVDPFAPTETLRPAEFQKYVERASAPTWETGVPRRRISRWWIAAAGVPLLIVAVLLAIPSLRARFDAPLFGSTEKHIAVLPFDNIGNDPANTPLAEGLMDSLSSTLSNLDVGNQSLWVVPSSVVRAREVDDPSAVLRELGATLAVKGSIEREGRDVQLTINLINAKTLRQIGSMQLEDPTGDLATLQNEAVSRLAKLMGIAVTPDMLKNTGGKVNPAAYQSYLTALGYIQRYDKPGNLNLAVAALNDAVKTDPSFALGYAGLADAYRHKYGVDPNPKWVDEAEADAEKAVQLDPHLSAVHITLARTQAMLGKYDLALEEFQRALQLDPHNPDALQGMAGTYERMGRIAEAEATFKQATALRPDYWDAYNSLGLFYDRQKRYADAVAQYRRVIDLTPDNAQAYSNLAGAYLDMDDPKVYQQAEQALNKSISLSPSYAAYANLGTLYYGEKRYSESAAMTEKALQFNDKDLFVWDNLASTYEWLKENSKATAARAKELALVQQNVKMMPKDAGLQSLLGILYAQKGLRNEAMDSLRMALALAPDDTAVLENVGEAYEDLGNRGEALKYVEEGLVKGYSLDRLKNDSAMQRLLADPNFRPNGK